MSYNGAGLFLINTAGQPVVGNTLIDAATFNAFTADVATGLSNVVCKDGQSTPTANLPMGNFKLTGLGLGTSSTDSARVDNSNVLNMCEGRLTLTSATPVTTAELVGLGTLYFTPFRGNRIALYDGSAWHMRTFTELSLDVTALTAAKLYDIFAYDNAGAVALEALVWTSDTARATALTTQDGVLVKTGALTRRYLGSIRTNSGSPLANDAAAFRWVWNYYNRVVKPMRVIDPTDTWVYSTNTFRQANGATTNQLDFVIGWAEDTVSAHVHATVKNNNPNFDHVVAIGLDSTTTMDASCINYAGPSQVANQYYGTDAHLVKFIAVGRHTLVWLELGPGAGTSTWLGDGGSPASTQSGIYGEIRC